MKKVLFLTIFVFLAACQQISQFSPPTVSFVQNQEVAPCSNGFDDVNVCQLKS
ncbi:MULTISPECIES: hypothetical protein [unclassified Acinetobacter]|uniref:hypothetical protein n=1 Tax=unclassified Acinetobacter TaxID=196816 RepID=UPI0029341CF5|nr:MULTISPECIES: hypothetical protein [unclassified Acinetobacter]WOE32535.1 hypothetical protein QSG84_04865 [Acinetobacter sp. SAAs470]WOE38011.1 hypothetical protein QSG86_13920 [Acinetobacter sp. SAAs474]